MALARVAPLPPRRQALAVTEAALGPSHPETGIRLNNLAKTLNALGRNDEALPLQQRAVEVTEAALGPNHASTAIIRRSLKRLQSAG